MGHVLQFEGFELPASFKVHYALSKEGDAVTQIGYDNQVTVPDVLVEASQEKLYAWLYIVDEDTGLTKFEIEIPIIARAKPTDEEPTPEEQSAIDQAIAALNDGVARAEQAADDAEQAMATKADKADTVLDTTLSRGRKPDTVVGEGSFAFGNNVEASGAYSFTAGAGSRASGNRAHAEGSATVASGVNSHAEGAGTVASGGHSHAEGFKTESQGMKSHAEGDAAKAIGVSSHAEGWETTASGIGSHAEGHRTTATELGSHAEGQSTMATDQGSHAEGLRTVASGASSHAEGIDTIASSGSSHAEGYHTIANASGMHAGGKFNAPSSVYDAWEATKHYYIGDRACWITSAYECIEENEDAVFDRNKWKIIYSTGPTAFVIGNGTDDDARSNAYALDWDGNGHYAGDVYVGANPDSTGGEKLAKESDVAVVPGEGIGSAKTKDFVDGGTEYVNRANGLGSFAEGLGTGATGMGSHAEGLASLASGYESHAEGYATLSTANATHAEGLNTVASANAAHAEGLQATASGRSSHAEGNLSVASGKNSHSEGFGTIAASENQHAQGKYNISDSTKKYADIVGNGANDANRSNAFALTWTGDGKYAGDVYVHSNTDSTGGNKLATEDYVDDAVSHISSMAIHICTSEEYNAETGVPTVANPDSTTFYLVPGGDSPNLYIEWVYVNDAWEKFGSATVDLSNYVQKTDVPVESGTGVGSVKTKDVIIDGVLNSNVSSGVASFAEGAATSATANGAHAEGFASKAIGTISHAEGRASAANGSMSHAEGSSTVSDGEVSHAEGTMTYANGANSHAEGHSCFTTGFASHAEGECAVLTTRITGELDATIYDFSTSHVIPENSYIEVSIDKGFVYRKVIACDLENKKITLDRTFGDPLRRKVASIYVYGSHGKRSHTEGCCATALSDSSHSEGYYSTSKGNSSHSEGRVGIAYGDNSHSEGNATVAYGDNSHAENSGILYRINIGGKKGETSCSYSSTVKPKIGDVISLYFQYPRIVQVDEENETITLSEALLNDYVDQECNTRRMSAFGENSHTEGNGSIALGNNQHVQGKFNVEDADGVYADIVGNGDTDDARSNAYALTWTGDGHYAGDVYAHSNPDSSGGVKLATEEDITVKDVQVNGTSVLNDGVANVPIASTNVLGIVQSDLQHGIEIASNGKLWTIPASDAHIKAASDSYRIISPYIQHKSVFYGLAKAAGDSTQSASSNAVGVYTDEAKAAIKTMLGITDGLPDPIEVTGATPTITATKDTRYVCGEVFTLTVTPPASGICIVRFTSGATPTVLTATGVVWPEWFDVNNLEANTIYEICITDGVYGAVMTWPQTS